MAIVPIKTNGPNIIGLRIFLAMVDSAMPDSDATLKLGNVMFFRDRMGMVCFSLPTAKWEVDLIIADYVAYLESCVLISAERHQAYVDRWRVVRRSLVPGAPQ